jgi:hypothetical protein
VIHATRKTFRFVALVSMLELPTDAIGGRYAPRYGDEWNLELFQAVIETAGPFQSPTPDSNRKTLEKQLCHYDQFPFHPSFP